MLELHSAKHEWELRPDGQLHVHLDCAHMGLGGDNSWMPTVHQEFLVEPGVFELEFLLAPRGDRTIDELPEEVDVH